MSTIITHCMKTDRPKIMILASDARTLIYQRNFDGWIIEIIGQAEKPFIDGVRFINCIVIAEDLRAFHHCFFEDDCQMLIKDFPKVIHSSFNAESVNQNRVSTHIVGRSWRDVLDYYGDDLCEAKNAYRKARMDAHPDQGGRDEAFHEVTQAWEQAQAEL